MIEVIREQVVAYRGAGKKQKGVMLSNLESVTHRSRKSLIRTMRREIKRSVEEASPATTTAPIKHKAKPGRPKKFNAECEAALAFIWKAYNHPSAERLIHELPEAIRVFKRDRMWSYSSEAT